MGDPRRRKCVRVVFRWGRFLQDRADLIRDLTLQGLDDVLVPLGLVRGPAHEVLHRARMHAEDEQHGRGRMPGVVQAAVAHVRCDQRSLPVRLVRAGVDRTPVRLRELNRPPGLGQALWLGRQLLVCVVVVEVCLVFDGWDVAYPAV